MHRSSSLSTINGAVVCGPSCAPPADRGAMRRVRNRGMNLAENQRERKAERCTGCGCKTVLPCLECWTERHHQRRGIWDPRDPHPDGLDRPSGVRRDWPGGLVCRIWLAVMDGMEADEILDVLQETYGSGKPLTLGKIRVARRAMLRYLKHHPEAGDGVSGVE